LVLILKNNRPTQYQYHKIGSNSPAPPFINVEAGWIGTANLEHNFEIGVTRENWKPFPIKGYMVVFVRRT